MFFGIVVQETNWLNPELGIFGDLLDGGGAGSSGPDEEGGSEAVSAALRFLCSRRSCQIRTVALMHTRPTPPSTRSRIATQRGGMARLKFGSSGCRKRLFQAQAAKPRWRWLTPCRRGGHPTG